MRNYYSEGDFDRLMLYPLCFGVIGTLVSGWSIVSHVWHGGGWNDEPWICKVLYVSLGLIGFGILLILTAKPKNLSKL